MTIVSAIIACLLVYVVIQASQLLYVFSQAWVAWSYGIHVKEIAVGVGPTLFKRQFGNWRFHLAAIPLYGFTAMPNEDDPFEIDTSFGEPILRRFADAALYQKLAILIIGPFSHLALGSILLGLPALLGAGRVAVSSPEDSMVYPCAVGGMVVEPAPSTWESQVHFVRQTSLEVMDRQLTFRTLDGFGGYVGFLVTCAATGTVDLFAVLSSLGAVLVYYGFFNLLPIPILNGGFIAIVVIEACIQTKLPMKVLVCINAAGLLFLVVLMGRLIVADGFWLYGLWFGS